MPDFESGSGIFDALSSLPYVGNAALSLNLDYYLNRSGRKAISPLVEHLLDDETWTIDSSNLTKLGDIIKARYTNKWNVLWNEYTSELPFFNNVNITTTSETSKDVEASGSSTLQKSGTETHKRDGTEETEDSFPTPRKSKRTISGGWNDNKSNTSTRTGTESTEESFPVARTSTKTMSGGYADTDTTTTTRTGSETASDTGTVSTSVFGFNSSTGVKSQTVGPDTNTQTQTTYNNVADARSGAITRQYNNMSEATTESGTRKLQTRYGEGQTGVTDSDSGATTRTYSNYEDTVEESGIHRKKTTFGQSGLTDALTFNDRKDETNTTDNKSETGSSSGTESGYNYRHLTDKTDVLQILYTDPMINNFYEVVFEDIDSILTCPYYTS